MKKAILLFTKVPKVGETKTRLTQARGGILTEKEASSFYEASMLDVLDVCLSVGQADVWVCYNKDGDRSYLDTLLAKVNFPQRIAGVFSDQGGHINDCIQYAADFILKEGRNDRLADAILIVGGDIPTLQPQTLLDAFAKMETLSQSEAGQKVACKKVETENTPLGACLVEGACQEGGYSIIGFTCTTPFNFTKMFYNLDGVTALDMLVNKAEDADVPLAALDMVPDVDIPVDLASLMPVLRVLELSAKYSDTVAVPKRTIQWVKEMGLQSVTLPPVRESV